MKAAIDTNKMPFDITQLIQENELLKQELARLQEKPEVDVRLRKTTDLARDEIAAKEELKLKQAKMKS